MCRLRTHRVEAALELGSQRRRPVRPSYERADDADHLQDLGNAALVEHHHGVAALDQFGGDVALEVRETENEVGFERLDLLVARVRERRDARLLACFRRAHRVARDPGDAVAFTEQVQRLGGLLGQADDPPRIRIRRHAPAATPELTPGAVADVKMKSRQANGGLVTGTPVSIANGAANIGPA